MKLFPRVNFGLALASLILSTFVWLHVQSLQELKVSRTVTLRLVPINLDESRYVIRIPESVQIIANGPLDAHEQLKDLLRSSRGTGIVATADLSDARPEMSSYRVRVQGTDQISRLGLELSDVPDVSVSIQEVLTKVIPIKAIPTNVPEGFAFSEAEIRPPSVTIRGAENDLARVDQVRVLLDLEGYAPGQKVTQRVEVLDAKLKPMTAPQISVTPGEVEITPSLAVAPPQRSLFVSVNFATGTRPAPGYRFVGYSVRPLTIMAKGNSSVLQRVQSVATEPISLTGLRSRTTRNVRLVAPREIGLLTERVQVTLDIEPIQPVENPAPANPIPSNPPPEKTNNP